MQAASTRSATRLWKWCRHRHTGGRREEAEDVASSLSRLLLSHSGDDPHSLYEALSPYLLRQGEGLSTGVVDDVLKRLWNDGPRALLFFRALLLHHPRYRPAASSFDHALDLAARLRDPHTVCRLLALRTQLGLLPSHRTFSILMEREAAAGRPDAAVRLFLSMHRHGCPQDLPAFNTLLDALCKSGRVAKASRLVAALGGRFRPDAVSYNTLADGWCRLKCVSRAVELLASMVREGVHPTTSTYNILLKGFFLTGQAARARELFREMKRRSASSGGCEPDVVTYTTLVHGLGLTGQTKLARKLFGEMVQRGCPPTVVTYNALIRVVRDKEKMMGEALNLVEEMLAKGCMPNAVTCNLVVRGLCLAGAAGEAAGFLDRMRRMGCEPSTQTYNVLIRHRCNAGEVEEGLRIFQAMEAGEVRCLPDRDTYRLLIRGMFMRRVADMATAGRLLVDMTTRGFVPPRRMVHRILDGLLVTGRQALAREIIRALGDRGGRLLRELRLR